MCQLTTGRTEPCRDNIGGIKNVYLFPYVSYSITQITRNKQLVTSFPTTTIYQFYTTNANFNEQISNDENGETYSQSLTFRLNKVDLQTTRNLNGARDLFFRYIVEFNNGSFRLGGLYQGANMTFTINSGGAKGDGSYYDITLEGNELISAPYLNNLNDFTIEQYLLLEDGSAMLTEEGEYITLE